MSTTLVNERMAQAITEQLERAGGMRNDASFAGYIETIASTFGMESSEILAEYDELVEEIRTREAERERSERLAAREALFDETFSARINGHTVGSGLATLAIDVMEFCKNNSSDELGAIGATLNVSVDDNGNVSLGVSKSGFSSRRGGGGGGNRRYTYFDNGNEISGSLSAYLISKYPDSKVGKKLAEHNRRKETDPDYKTGYSAWTEVSRPTSGVSGITRVSNDS